ncbi:hypothetical protein J7E83_13450 [Arthrobacter sp. ISL-48]|uniref:hypothetical protein n=1 Tax=Arthrobacter sp. ISL-48 TaxID=2819110 RepID=UPI001BE91FCB|nr:hypothetical protein [Arthrobacter sp. ISL-48]MBT2533109.1 hypothetical protein [Arthrobacter sp. ISL-48]
MEAMRRTVVGILAALFLLTATACSITTVDRGYVPPPPLAPLDQLEQAALVDPAGYSAGEGVLSFITEDHNVACSLTSARGEHLNLPYEANSFSDPANNKLATVPVAHCELAAYAKPSADDVKDDCAGTSLGYLGGTALLTPDTVRYGDCRSGVTQMEAAYGPKGSKSGPLTQLPVLADGQNIERNGLRCSAYNGGVACGNVSAGVAFFVARDRYELIFKAPERPSPASDAPSKTP